MGSNPISPTIYFRAGPVRMAQADLTVPSPRTLIGLSKQKSDFRSSVGRALGPCRIMVSQVRFLPRFTENIGNVGLEAAII